jgi:hypothetical protein
VTLPYALVRKYPSAHLEWCWQYVFPARQPSRDRARPRGGGITSLKRQCSDT